MFKRAEYELVSSELFMQQYVALQAYNLAHEYCQLLRGHLVLMHDNKVDDFEYCLYRFGQNLGSVLRASLLLKAKITILTPLDVGWPVSGISLNRTYMAELNDASKTESLVVTMTLLPFLWDKVAKKPLMSCKVCCHTAKQEQDLPKRR